ncbi:hypothetical protein P3L10_020329 [Capsicum annuum]
MSLKIDSIREISNTKMQWNMKVRIVPLWQNSTHENHSKILSLEMLLQDDKGDRIQASIGASVISKFRPEIKKQELYSMKNFIVVPNKSKVQANDHKMKLMFTHRTNIQKIVHPCFDKTLFKFHPFELLINQVDIDENKLFGNYPLNKFFNLNVSPNVSNTIEATFWTEFAEQIRPHLDKSTDKPVIVVMQLIKAHKFKEKFSVHNFWTASKLWINPELPEVADFIFRYFNKLQYMRVEDVHGDKSERISQLSSQQSYSISDELASGAVEVKTIKQLIECMDEGSFYVAATIIHIDLEKNWSYLSCKNCSRKVDELGSKFYCKTCESLESSAIHRYKLFLKVTDVVETDFITLLLWNQYAMNLIGRTTTELVKASLENGCVSSYQLELDNILDREVMFKVAVKKETIDQHNEVYTVLKFSDDKDLIKQYRLTPSEETCTDSVAENEVNSALTTSTKRSKFENELSMVDVDEDPSVQLSSSKRRKFIKKEKIT